MMANPERGLRRGNEDKRRAAAAMVKARPEWSDARIAAHVGVHNETVASARGQLTESVDSTEAARLNPPVREGRDGEASR